ncbi:MULTISPECIES: type A2 lanthipeptide [Streptococcus]|nr:MULTISPECIES: type A2 lanthipeptide [Streptococcus]
MMNNTNPEIYVQTATDQEIALLVGGAGSGLVKTLTKDCPGFLSNICVNIGFISGCKNC